MTKINSESLIITLDEEIDRLMFLGARITQMALNIRKNHLSDSTLTVKDTESYYEYLLSMIEHIDGSAILLESLLSNKQKNSLLFENKRSVRIHYTRDQLLKLRQNVTSTLSDEIKNLLKQVVERESNDSVETERKSWRDIRTILV